LQTHRAIIDKINNYGKNNIPFVLFVDFLMNETHCFTLDELEVSGIEISFPHFRSGQMTDGSCQEKVEIEKKNISFDEYEKGFNVVKKNLDYGNSYLTNLTFTTPIETKNSLQEIFQFAEAKYKINFKNEWICFSPETFIKIEDGKIFSFPMKGTIDASIENAEQLILTDEKETAEHYTIVDLIRNDLSIVATNVHVEKFRYIDTIKTSNKTLLQISSKIVGDLPTHYFEQLGDIIFSLLPAGSISGAPKKKTIEIIQAAEMNDRGFYTGTCFYFDGKTIDSCVLIRFIEQTTNGLVYKSGGGITINSEVEKEYQELIDKIYVPTL
jgi:para-aminobenzoate synthetase component 1